MTIEEALKSGKKLLADKKIENTRFITKVLLQNLMNVKVSYLFINYDEELNKEIELKYFDAIDKIINGIPLAYIVKYRYFIKLKFYVDENVLIPQPDTEILVEEAIKIILEKKVTKVLDLCTGSGAIAISIENEVKDLEITASDVSRKAIEVAKKNKQIHNSKIKIIESDLFDKIKDKFDMIVSNPPYIKTEEIKTLEKEVQNEPKIALDGGIDGLAYYKRIIKDAKDYLNENGYLLVEIGYNQREDVMELFEKEGYKNIYCIKDYSENDRVIVGQK